ncbi:unnamed protein product, partial [Porites lobata]
WRLCASVIYPCIRQLSHFLKARVVMAEPIQDDHLQTKHRIDWDSATCITYSTDYYQRLTLESWFTNLKQTPLNLSIQGEEHIKTKMANTKQFLSVPLTRKYGSMPLLVPQKSVISLEYKEKGSIPRRGTFGGSEALKTRNIEHDVKEIREVKPVTRLPETFIAKPVQSSISYRREIAYRSPLLERRQSMGAMKTPTLEKKAPGTSQPRLQENKKVKESRQSERLSETSALHDRHNGVNVINVKANTRVQTHEQGNGFYKRQETRGVKSKKKQLSRKRDIPDKTAITRKNDGKSSEVVSLERESHFQDYRQKCVQWLKSLPDTEMPQPTTLR